MAGAALRPSVTFHSHSTLVFGECERWFHSYTSPKLPRGNLSKRCLEDLDLGFYKT